MNSLWNLVSRENLVPAGYTTVLVVLLALTVWLVIRFNGELKRDSPRIESHWGGLGGGLGGWEFSSPFAYLVAAICFAILSITVLRDAADYLKPTQDTEQTGASESKAEPAETVSTSQSGPAEGSGKTGAGTGGTAKDVPKQSADTARVAPADETKK